MIRHRAAALSLCLCRVRQKCSHLLRDVLGEPLRRDLGDRAIRLHLVEDLLHLVAQLRVILRKRDAELAHRTDDHVERVQCVGMLAHVVAADDLVANDGIETTILEIHERPSSRR